MAGGLTLRHKILAARLALAAERSWPLFCPAAGSVSVFAAYALYDIPRALPPVWNGLVLLCWIAATAALIRRALTVWRWPSHAEACRRLELDSGVAHRPLAALADRPVHDRTRLLWTDHVSRMRALISDLRPKPPRFRLEAADPWGARFWVLVPVGLGLAVGGADAPARLKRAIIPDFGLDAGLKVWISPPAATGLSAWEMDRTQSGEIEIPDGSILRAAAAGGWTRATVVVDGRGKDFEGDGDQHVETVLENPHRIVIRRALLPLASWTVKAVPDLPPAVAFLSPPAAVKSKVAVRVSLEAHDDYGLARVWVRASPAVGAPVDLELPLSAGKPRAVSIEGVIGGGAEYLSGQTVVMEPMARDTAGQESAGRRQSMLWPERAFADPQAQALAQWRKDLINDPAKAPEIAERLDELSNNISDLAGVLDIGVAKRGLREADPDIGEAQGLMLGAADRLEDQAAQRTVQMMNALGDALDKALKRRDAEAIRALAERYAGMLEKLLGPEDRQDASYSLSQKEVEDILGRLDLASGTNADGQLRRRLEELERRIAGRTEGKDKDSADPFGNRTGGRADGDDGSTKIPGQTAPSETSRIIEDIRNRLMDGTKIKPERDYLKRLLDLDWSPPSFPKPAEPTP